MIAFLLANWRWIAPSFVALALGAMLGLRTVEYGNLKATIAVERQQAQAAALKATQEAKAKDDANDKLSRDLEATKAQAEADIDSTRADFTERLRLAAATACHSSVPRTAARTPDAAPVAAGSDRGRASPDLAGFVQLRDLAMKLQDDLKLCVNWANGVGR